MSEAQAVRSQQLPDFVDLEFARRLEMAETMLPECVEAILRNKPSRPPAARVVPSGAKRTVWNARLP